MKIWGAGIEKNCGSGAEPLEKISIFSGAKRMNYQSKTFTNAQTDHMAEVLQQQQYRAVEELQNQC